MPSLLCVRSAILLCGVGLALANGLYAQNIFRAGNEFSASDPRLGDQTLADVAIGPAGGYVVWQDNAIDGRKGSYGIGARKLDQNFTPLYPIFRVNHTINLPQENPQVAMMPNGGAAFVWQGGRMGAQDVFLRVRLPNGKLLPVTADARVNQYTPGQQGDPAVAALANGNLAVVWSSLRQDGHMQGVFGRIMTGRALPVGRNFRVNQFTGNSQRNAAIATLANGNFVVVWVSENQDVAPMEVLRHTNRVHAYGRVFSPGGIPYGNEFRVNTRSNLCASPSVARSGATGFTIAWAERSDNRDDNWDIHARSFWGPDVPAGDAVRVNDVTYGDQVAPRIAAAGAQHLVVWTGLALDGSREGVFGRLLDYGLPTGADFLVNTHTSGSQVQPAVAGDNDSRLLVAWSSYLGLSSFDIRAQQLSTDTAPSGVLVSSVVTLGSERQDPGSGMPFPGQPPTVLTPLITSGSGSSSGLRVTMATTSKGKRLSWNTDVGKVYQVQYSTNFSNWTDLGAPRLAAATSDSMGVGEGENAAFYRVIRLP